MFSDKNLSRSIAFVLAFSVIHAVAGQPVTEKKVMLRDTIDNNLDFSRFLLEARGFLPMAMPITEPALGHIGLGAGLLFLRPHEPLVPGQYIPPDITVAFGMYTANSSWMMGGARIGSLPKWGLKYRIGGAYGTINLTFYRTIVQEEQEFSFALETLPLLASLSRKISKSDIYLGIRYLFMKTTVSPNFNGDIPAFITEKELQNDAALLGVFIDWDKRDNIFTPDRGYRLNTEYGINDDWTGSDFSYDRMTGTFTWFFPLRKNWISGLRVEGQHVTGDPPFYLLPAVNMRGIPAARYQGVTIALIETEQRYDFNRRWSGLVFVGVAMAREKDESFSEAGRAYSVGGGFRYLLARLFNIRAGVDIAGGSGGFGYYIVFGHNWNR